MSAEQRLHVVAQIVEACERPLTEADLLEGVATLTGLTPARLWGLLGLAEDLMFVQRDSGRWEQTTAGRKFAAYMASHVAPAALATPSSEAYQVCMSLPPVWRAGARQLVGDTVLETAAGERRVAEAAEDRLYIVTPFLSPDVLQYKLQDVLKPGAEVVVYTSDPAIGREDWETNHLRRRLAEILGRRFGRVRIYHFDSAGMIIHAKLWLSEGGFFLTSANVKGDSANDNFEVGLYSSNPSVAAVFRRFLEGLPQMEGVRCLA